MDPNSGRLYSEEDLKKLRPEEQHRMVKLEGRQEDIERISGAVKRLSRAERRAANRAAGLRSNGEPKR